MSILTPEQRRIQEETKAFVAREIIPHAAAYDKRGEFHAYLLEAARDSHIFAMAVPKEFGGLDYDSLTQAVVLEAWAYGCAGMATTLAASILSMDSVLVAGTHEQKKRYFAPLVRGEIGSFGLTEPGAGSDAGNGKTTAIRDGDSYVLNGSKCWITNGGHASVFVIYALTDPAKGMKGLSAFIVEKGLPGFTVGAVDHKLGIRSSNTVELLFKDVRVPAANLLGREGEGMSIAMKTLDLARPAMGAVALGIAQRALDACVMHLRTKFPDPRIQPGQTVQFKLADMQIRIEEARELLHHVMRLRDANLPFSLESAITKTSCGDTAMAITAQAVQLMGAHGYTSELAKLMRDAKIMQIYEGTNQIQRLVIARAILTPPRPATATPKGANGC
ncbi:MAG: acyl-CoA dehydrogenase [Holophaga sp.]|nr:acyl-CoA dehydrogenase [Holophaga sp.]